MNMWVSWNLFLALTGLYRFLKVSRPKTNANPSDCFKSQCVTESEKDEDAPWLMAASCLEKNCASVFFGFLRGSCVLIVVCLKIRTFNYGKRIWQIESLMWNNTNLNQIVLLCRITLTSQTYKSASKRALQGALHINTRTCTCTHMHTHTHTLCVAPQGPWRLMTV